MSQTGGVRVDLLLLECLGQLVKDCGGAVIWDGGLRQISAEKIKEFGIPSEPITVVEAARHAGILKPNRKPRKQVSSV